MRDLRQFQAYLAALAIAFLGIGTFEATQWVDISASSYRNITLDWLGALGGGLVFGLGAMHAGGCASRTLIRSAEGNLGAIITLLSFAMAGMATLFGILNPVRGWLIQHTAIPLQTEHVSLMGLAGLPAWSLPLACFLCCVAAILYLGGWRVHKQLILLGASLGLLIGIAWWITGAAGQDEFYQTAPKSVSVAGPLSRTAVYITTEQTTGNSFSLSLLAGLFAGALISALVSREFRWVAPAGNRVGAYLSGGALMGVGAIFAGGCNIGQGLTGLATLSTQSVVAVTGIIIGMLLGLWRLQRSGG